jgi:hypothetical protein
MSVAVLVLLIAVIVAGIGLLVAMHVKDKPLYGATAVGVLLVPGTVLAFLYASLAQG